MVLTYLLDEEVPIEYLAKKYSSCYITGKGIAYRFFTESAKEFGLEAPISAKDWEEARTALENGHVLIAACMKDSIFTASDAGHYIVLAGITDDDKIIVRDPNLYNYSIYNYPVREEGYKYGFEDESLKYYSCPIWIYPKKDIESIATRIENGIPLISEEADS